MKIEVKVKRCDIQLVWILRKSTSQRISPIDTDGHDSFPGKTLTCFTAHVVNLAIASTISFYPQFNWDVEGRWLRCVALRCMIIES